MSKPLRVAVFVKRLKYDGALHVQAKRTYVEVWPEILSEHATVPRGAFFLTHESPIPKVGDLVVLEQTETVAYHDRSWRCWRVVESENE
jgi:hypothetical protein